MGLDIYFHKTKCFTSDDYHEIEKFDDEDIKNRFSKTFSEAYQKYKKVYESGDNTEILIQREKFVTALKPYFNYEWMLNALVKADDLTPELIEEWFARRRECMYSPYVAYFRKVNFIWRFFEDLEKVSFNDTNWCFVDETDLDTLIELCKDVLEHYKREFSAMKSFENIEQAKHDADNSYKINWNSNIFKLEDNEDFAEQTLPTQSGFFFGSTTYDYRYLLDVEDALTQFTKLRKNLHPETERVYVYFSY